MINCVKCNNPKPNDQKFCPQCGQEDGKAITTENKAAENHGINVIVNNANTMVGGGQGYGIFSTKSRAIAFILCLLLGWLGIHRFYLGKTVTGLIWFFTFGIFGLGWLIDTISLLTNGMRDGQGLPLKAEWEFS